MGVNPFAFDELLEQGAVETAGTAIVDILDAGLLAQFGDAQSSREAFVLAPGYLAIKQEPQPFVMAEAVGFPARGNFGEALGHSKQAKGVELVQSRMFEQDRLS